MCEVYGFTRLISVSNGRQHVSEYTYFGNVDDDGCFRLTEYTGHIYPAREVKAADSGTPEEISNMSKIMHSNIIRAVYHVA